MAFEKTYAALKSLRDYVAAHPVKITVIGAAAGLTLTAILVPEIRHTVINTASNLWRSYVQTDTAHRQGINACVEQYRAQQGTYVGSGSACHEIGPG